MDEGSTSFHFKNIFTKKNLITHHLENPCLYPKAIKNNVELEGARRANMRDGVSVTKFLYWLKNNNYYRMRLDEITSCKLFIKSS